MTNFTPMFSSDKDYWETPQSLFDELNAEFNFTLDAAGANSLSRQYRPAWQQARRR